MVGMGWDGLVVVTCWDFSCSSMSIFLLISVLDLSFRFDICWIGYQDQTLSSASRACLWYCC
ncbi:hypothetical protein CsSME_00024931 [Camellia sinensis var. sinensis]